MGTPTGALACGAAETEPAVYAWHRTPTGALACGAAETEPAVYACTASTNTPICASGRTSGDRGRSGGGSCRARCTPPRDLPGDDPSVGPRKKAFPLRLRPKRYGAAPGARGRRGTERADAADGRPRRRT